MLQKRRKSIDSTLYIQPFHFAFCQNLAIIKFLMPSYILYHDWSNVPYCFPGTLAINQLFSLRFSGYSWFHPQKRSSGFIIGTLKQSLSLTIQLWGISVKLFQHSTRSYGPHLLSQDSQQVQPSKRSMSSCIPNMVTSPQATSSAPKVACELSDFYMKCSYWSMRYSYIMASQISAIQKGCHRIRNCSMLQHFVNVGMRWT